MIVGFIKILIIPKLLIYLNRESILQGKRLYTFWKERENRGETKGMWKESIVPISIDDFA